MATKRKFDSKAWTCPIPCQESPPSAVAFTEDVDTYTGYDHFPPQRNKANVPPAQAKPAPVDFPDDLRLLFSTLGRDAILAYAQRLYNEEGVPAPFKLTPTPLFTPSQSVKKENIYSSHLLPLLYMLRKAHPDHIPTMLLLSCVYYAMGNYQESLDLNEHLLKIEPQCVRSAKFV